MRTLEGGFVFRAMCKPGRQACVLEAALPSRDSGQPCYEIQAVARPVINCRSGWCSSLHVSRPAEQTPQLSVHLQDGQERKDFFFLPLEGAVVAELAIDLHTLQMQVGHNRGSHPDTHTPRHTHVERERITNSH